MTWTGETARPARAARLPLRRPPQGRWVAGVCTGLAAHLGLPVGVVRLAMAAGTLAAGAGVALYVFLWVTVPTGDPNAPGPTPRRYDGG